MFELPCLGKGFDFFAGELWPVVGDHCIWTSVSGKVVLELQNDSVCLSVWQFVHFPEVAVVVDTYKVTFALELEEICPHFYTGSCRNFMW